MMKTPIDKEKKTSLLFLGSIILFLLLGFLGLLFGKANTELERRAPHERPKFSKDALFNLTLPRETELFLADRFPFRKELICLNATSNLFLQGGEYRHVILGKDHTLIAEGKMPDMEGYLHTLQGIRTLADTCQEKGIPLLFAAVPEAEEVHARRFPCLYEGKDYTAFYRASGDILEKKTVCDIKTPLLTAKEQTYFATDHHWNDKGAYLAYRTIVNRMGMKETKADRTEQVGSTFLGTSLSRLGLFGYKADTLCIPHFDDENDFVVYRNEEDVYMYGFYDYSKADTVDAYSIYLGGNGGIIRVEREKGAEKKRERILLVRDSFASSLAPYLAKNGDLVLYDPRYTQKSVYDAIKTYDVDRVLVVASISSLSTRPYQRAFLDL